MVLLLINAYSCKNKPGEINSEFHFVLLDKSETNIDFNNRITENDSVNFLTNQYIYIGSGVGIGDFNNDGLQDIFFSGEQVSCKLYLNKGNFTFEDITEQAGLRTNKWCAGVSIVDINNDGLIDIYVAVSHAPDEQQRKNLLFINQGNLKFKEQASGYGLDNTGFSTQSAFFDYDKDGDLDMYLMNHTIFQNQPNNIVTHNAQATAVATDLLFRNEGVPAGGNHPVFKDVSAEAGISDHGYGLGLAISDVNMDGWPDIYVANDFLSNDQLWLNNKNGSFTNRVARCLQHQSFNSMGVDIADFNNDQLPDIAVLDMQPETNYRKKTMFAGVNQEKYEMEQKFGGFQPQFTRNMLQLHNGNRLSDSSSYQPFYSEIGQLSGISETDWSWSVLMADFDNDGWKDMQITNGIAKDLTNNDFLFFRNTPEQSGTVGTRETEVNYKNSLLKDLDAHGSISIDNYFYLNNGDLTFTNTTRQTGMSVPSISHGAVYADLDNDGDLDMVINNMNQEAFIWKNQLRKTVKDSLHNFLTIKLKGRDGNRSGIGAKLMLHADGKVQFLEQNTTRGYLSSVDDRLHFGLGKTREIDSLKIVWPDGKAQLLEHIKTNQFIDINYDNAHTASPFQEPVWPVLFSSSA
ncbi:MAG: CRTAC1 family protein, partial [Ferruginibacter sp.]